MTSERSIAELLARAKAGDRAAFGTLIDAHYDFLYRTAYKWCGSREDAEDVAQDVCIKLATALAGFDGRSAFTSWLYRIVLNAVRDRQRQAARHVRWAGALAMTAEVSTPAQQADAMDDAELWDAVRALPERQRDAVLLVYAEEKSHAEAAAIMGAKESTVSWYIHEARKALKGMVQDEKR
ncbi:RNA polymerase sigma factor [Pelagibacterium xiamenense]|uniref:RNA polymerase sigma factor n=1 Tax=Pelagibacterium xiamenense TaxID=2901140 RepID=UPI001E3B2DA0|nr:RNA polymerase sigma factor [Pelagibacterium xiamenense]